MSIIVLTADKAGRFRAEPGLFLAGREWDELHQVEDDEVVPLPSGASLVMLPGRHPVGLTADGEPVTVYGDEGGRPVWGVAALLPQGYTRLYVPATDLAAEQAEGRSKAKNASEATTTLPLLGYTAVGWDERRQRYVVAATQTDDATRWNPARFSTAELGNLIQARLAEFPNNRLIRHLARCAAEWSCFTAQNIFYRRWEGGLPVSPACNAGCYGCLSSQPPESGFPAAQERLDFSPTAAEIAEIAIAHLDAADDAIVSFGQGCEGEPSLQADLILEAIARTRRMTRRGTINMNTNGSRPDAIASLCRQGLDSIRVSMISAREEVFQRYYRPRHYSLADVRQTIRRGREAGARVSINLLAFPGLTDRERELEGWLDLIRTEKPHMLQVRNLNVDPDVFQAFIDPDGVADASWGEIVGLRRFLETVRREFPWLEIGSFTHPAR